MSETSETIRVEHKPHLIHAWQVRVFNPAKNKWSLIDARKTEAAARGAMDLWLARQARRRGF